MKAREIKQIVAEHYSVDIDTKSRKLDYLIPRQIAIYLCRKHTKLSYAAIGRIFGKDHSTIMQACNKIERIKDDLPDDIDKILGGYHAKNTAK